VEKAAPRRCMRLLPGSVPALRFPLPHTAFGVDTGRNNFFVENDSGCASLIADGRCPW
jgi:hypothetical protein